jgi:hypothetical protein
MSPNLPDFCYAVHPSSKNIILLKKGDFGCWWHSDARPGVDTQQICDDLNAKIGVSKAQVEAMLAGSMFGWDAPAADPKWYASVKENANNPHKYTDTMAQLQGKIVLVREVLNDETIIAAGPLTKQPGTVAYRIVLRRVEGVQPFVVHMQRFPDIVYRPGRSTLFGNLMQSDFAEGIYFYANEFHKAVEAFGKKVADHANFTQSLYRDE